MKILPVRRVSHVYTQVLIAKPEKVFPLLCPVREKEWIKDWEPLWVISNSGLAEQDAIFSTEENNIQSIWYITQYVPEKWFIEILKTTINLTVCRIQIQLRATETGSDAIITYTHTSLSTEGDQFIEAFTEQHYLTFMQQWEDKINYFLRHKKMLSV